MKKLELTKEEAELVFRCMEGYLDACVDHGQAIDYHKELKLVEKPLEKIHNFIKEQNESDI